VDVVERFSMVRYVQEILEIYDRQAGKSGTGYKEV
jgi:hypothetical protein